MLGVQDFSARILYRRYWKVFLLVAVFLGMLLYLGPFFAVEQNESPFIPLANPFLPKPISTPYPTAARNAANKVRPTVPTLLPTRAPIAPNNASKIVRELPFAVNFSHRTDLNFDRVQGSSILVYDVQWVPTLSAVVLIIADRIIPDSRSPIQLGPKALNNSIFFPNVTVTPVQNKASGVPVQADCTDMPKYSKRGKLLVEDGIGAAISIVACTMPVSFRDRLSVASAASDSDRLHVQFPELAVEIPLATSSASKYFKQVSRRNPPPLREPKATASVCIVGMWQRGIAFAREVVQYHLVSGMSHVYLSYTGDMTHDELLETSGENITRDFKLLEATLADFISEGKASVILAPGIMYDVKEERNFIDLYAKLPFLQSCLWHSKAYDNYTAVVDFDEIILINDTKRTNITTAIASFIEKEIDRPDRSAPQCFLQLDVFSTCPSNSNSALLGVKFPFRESSDYQFHKNLKSVALTQRAKYLGLHGHGVCQPFLPLELMDRDNGASWDALADDATLMDDLHKPNRNLTAYSYNFYGFHFMQIYGPRDFDCVTHGNATNEYHSIWFPEVKKELQRRCKESKPLNQHIALHCDQLQAVVKGMISAG